MEILVVFIQQLINGISLGSIYALIALGYTMVYGIVMLINFAHGDILMVGAYTGFYILEAMGTVALFSRPFVRRLDDSVRSRGNHDRALRVQAAQVRAAAQFAYNGDSRLADPSKRRARVLPFVGPNPRQFPTMPTVNISIGIFSISNIQVIVIVVSIVLMLALNYIINRTKIGKAMRAVSYDMKAASLMGISVNKVVAFTFALGSVLAAAGGILFATAYPQIDPTMGSMPGLKAFVAAVLGGIGSVPGAMLGGYILGVAETMTKGFLSSQFSDAISFSILILILLVKPTGIMGTKIRVKV